MNQQERQALQDFLHELVQAQAGNKDREAEALIVQAANQQPDTLYLLVQRALLQELASNNAQRHIAALERQLNTTSSNDDGGFLDPVSAWGRSARPSRLPAEKIPATESTLSHASTSSGIGSPPARPGLMSGGAGSFLGSMAATAAGVAAGSFLFHGIGQLLHPGAAPGSAHQGLAELSGDQAAPDRTLADSGSDNGSLAQDAGINDIGSLGDDGWSDTGGDDSGVI